MKGSHFAFGQVIELVTGRVLHSVVVMNVNSKTVLGAYYNGPKFKCQLESGTG